MIQLRSESETQNWGHKLAESLVPGSVIALYGNLGAGKTQVTKGIVSGLGSIARVTSPTFTLVHEYTDGRLPVFHFDFYRVEDAVEILSLGWDEYLDEPGVMVVEWADRFMDLMPKQTRWIQIRAESPELRIVEEARPRS
jgi:tRNA threonylcarbamoyladenosine biosynthesis protein TsaE